MSTDIEIERALATIAAALNEHNVDGFDAYEVQRLVTVSLDGTASLTVDQGGGLHDETGARVGAIRRTDSGEWITERQNADAEHSGAAIPAEPPS
jgi:hypothetical protein